MRVDVKTQSCSLLNVQAPSEEISDDSKDILCEELEQFFIIFLSTIKSLLGDINAKLERGSIFKPTIGNDSLHQDSNDNGVR